MEWLLGDLVVVPPCRCSHDDNQLTDGVVGRRLGCRPDRLAVVTLQQPLSRAPSDDPLHVELRIDGEPLEIRARPGDVQVRYGAASEPQAVISVPYEPMIAHADSRISQEEFQAQVTVEGSQEAAFALFQRLEQGLQA